MRDTETTDDAAVTPQASPGELLLHERENQGLDLEEVAAALNLRPAVIRGLEQDSYEEVPVAAYQRGYLRAYARLLGMDEQHVISLYKARFGKEEGEIERKVTPVQVTKPPSRLGAWIFRLATLLVIAGLVGLTLLWWQSRGGSQPPLPADSGPVAVDSLDGRTTITEEDTPAEAPGQPPTAADAGRPAPAEGAPTAASPSPGATPEGGAAGAATPSDTPAEVATEPAPAAAEPDAEQATTEETPEPAPDPRVLSFTFNEQSWTEIFDADNQRIFVGLQEPGTTARVEGEPPFRLTVGNATGVELVWRDEVVDLGERAGANNVARFTLGE